MIKVNRTTAMKRKIEERAAAVSNKQQQHRTSSKFSERPNERASERERASKVSSREKERIYNNQSCVVYFLSLSHILCVSFELDCMAELNDNFGGAECCRRYCETSPTHSAATASTTIVDARSATASLAAVVFVCLSVRLSLISTIE